MLAFEIQLPSRFYNVRAYTGGGGGGGGGVRKGGKETRDLDWSSTGEILLRGRSFGENRTGGVSGWQ